MQCYAIQKRHPAEGKCLKLHCRQQSKADDTNYDGTHVAAAALAQRNIFGIGMVQLGSPQTTLQTLVLSAAVQQRFLFT